MASGLLRDSREAVVSQWDLESGKKLTTSHHGAEQVYHECRMVTKVLYSLDGKQLVSLGIGAECQKME